MLWLIPPITGTTLDFLTDTLLMNLSRSAPAKRTDTDADLMINAGHANTQADHVTGNL